MNYWLFFGLFWWLWFLGELAEVPQLVGAHTSWEDPSDKAMALFLSWLSPKQKLDFLKYGYFYVIGSDTGLTYKINKAVAPFNVEQLEGNQTRKRICFVPYLANFMGDIMLAQKIGLENMEDHVLKIANNYQNWQNMIPELPVDRLA